MPASPPPRPKKKKKLLPAVGWREWVALPELGIERIKAKVDTGARSSALHAFHVRLEEVDGESWVTFAIHPRQRDAHTTVDARARLLEKRWIRSSNGQRQLRPVILTPVRIGRHSFPIEITLVNRDVMGFRMLLGRQAVRRRFLVDPGRSFRAGEPALHPPHPESPR